MLTVVCWIWRGERVYLPAHVNALRRMLARHLHVPHRLVCITDETGDFDQGVTVMPTPAAAMRLAHMKTPEGSRMPSCYRRLWVFSDEARCLGERILLTDVDAVITGDITHLVERTESFVGWRPGQAWGNHERVAGGMYLLSTGAHPEVWDDFGEAGIGAARRAGYRGSDQAWLSYKLGRRAALWSDEDGIYALSDIRDGMLPEDARIVQFAGNVKPWSFGVSPWVLDHYPMGERVDLQPNDFRRLVLKHRGKRIVVMGGAPSLDAEIDGLEADVWISANEHGAKRRAVDYVVAMDEQHGGLKVPMRSEVRKYTDAPIIGPWPFNDYQLVTWPGAPRKGLSGMVATWVAWAMGGHPIILAGFDGYGGSKLAETRKVAPHVRGVVRVMGGPLAQVWDQYRPGERIGKYIPHSSINGLLGVDGMIQVRALKPCTVRGHELPKGSQMQVMRHEVARLLRHRMLEEV